MKSSEAQARVLLALCGALVAGYGRAFDHETTEMVGWSLLVGSAGSLTQPAEKTHNGKRQLEGRIPLTASAGVGSEANQAGREPHHDRPADRLMGVTPGLRTLDRRNCLGHELPEQGNELLPVLGLKSRCVRLFRGLGLCFGEFFRGGVHTSPTLPSVSTARNS